MDDSSYQKFPLKTNPPQQQQSSQSHTSWSANQNQNPLSSALLTNGTHPPPQQQQPPLSVSSFASNPTRQVASNPFAPPTSTNTGSNPNMNSSMSNLRDVPTLSGLGGMNASGSPAKDARRIIYPGKSADPYWDAEQLIKQVQEGAIPIFEELFPNCTGVFIFDQSSAHNAFAKDALNVRNMNVRPGGKQSIMHDTIIPHDNPNPKLRGKVQSMVFPSNHPTHANQPKGIAEVLCERGLYNLVTKGVRGKPVGKCKKCDLASVRRQKALERMKDTPEFYSSVGKLLRFDYTCTEIAQIQQKKLLTMMRAPLMTTRILATT